MNCIADLIRSSRQLVTVSDTPQLDVELLLCKALDKSRTWLKTWPEKELSEGQKAYFQQLFNRRLAGEPIAYIIGTQGFWNLELEVSPETLIPRPETEILVEATLALDLPDDTHILDLGTGTGAIALALASENLIWQVTAVDQSAQAVELAERNRQNCGVHNVQVFESDWYTAVEGQQFDVIVSNPPYIDINDTHLLQGDVRFEPSSALVAGADGLDDLRVIIAGAGKYLVQCGWLLVEHGYQQGKAVQQLFEQAGFHQIETRYDLNGLERVTRGCL